MSNALHPAGRYISLIIRPILKAPHHAAQAREGDIIFMVTVENLIDMCINSTRQKNVIANSQRYKEQLQIIIFIDHHYKHVLMMAIVKCIMI